ncbi:ABC transporter permease [Bacillus sp. FJAT-49732]|uniref:ABC transporter permease n=1 Tax=Lederbergia citrisecunda TaxID=2833583 RepID=A0A942TNB2_9BACI|nr:ABC transporter permease [Lederbergia citrisecunda]MBS4200473.1 ABC transporter permease [Lederbergia citrisecunda]
MQRTIDFFNIICGNKRSLVGLIILIFFFLMATVGPFIFKLDMGVDYENRYSGPTWDHWLGTDYGGRDTWTQLVHGSKEVITIGFLTAVITMIFGSLLGMISGLIGGKVDTGIMLITNLFLTIPSFPIFIMLAAILSIRDPISFALVLSAWSWPGLTRAVRSQVISLKERDFIVICRVMNLSLPHIVFKELMPNIVSYLAINFVLIMRGAIVGSVGLMMLGLAPYSPTNWGQMLSLAISQTGGIFNPNGYIYVLSPIVCLALFQLGAIFFANGLDEALNPRLRGNA